jgi:hypothetical protein
VTHVVTFKSSSCLNICSCENCFVYLPVRLSDFVKAFRSKTFFKSVASKLDNSSQRIGNYYLVEIESRFLCAVGYKISSLLELEYWTSYRKRRNI